MFICVCCNLPKWRIWGVVCPVFIINIDYFLTTLKILCCSFQWIIIHFPALSALRHLVFARHILPRSQLMFLSSREIFPARTLYTCTRRQTFPAQANFNYKNKMCLFLYFLKYLYLRNSFLFSRNILTKKTFLLTCKKLDVWGFHFSSGLPCHVLRILKQTWKNNGKIMRGVRGMHNYFMRHSMKQINNISVDNQFRLWFWNLYLLSFYSNSHYFKLKLQWRWKDRQGNT